MPNRKLGAAAAIRFGLAQIGKPYKWGAQGPNAYDCSGLMFDSYKHAGYTIPRTTEAMLADKNLMPITRSQLAPGDLVFPESGHVQMYLGGGRVLEAPHTGLNVRVTSLGNVQFARRVTDPAPGVYGTDAKSPVSDTEPVGLTQAAFQSGVSEAVGLSIPNFFVNIFAPIGSWLIWMGEAGIGLMMIGAGLFLLMDKSLLNRIGNLT